jgi:hypothetical protein
MKFYVGQPVWAIFHPDDDDESKPGEVKVYGRFAGVISAHATIRKSWRRLWRRFDWDVDFDGCPNEDYWCFDEGALEPRDPDQFAVGRWDKCSWSPARETEVKLK